MGLETIGTYITNHQKTISQYISTSPILNLCLAVERNPGLRVPKWWWEQEGMEWEGEHEAAMEDMAEGTQTKEAGESEEEGNTYD